MLVPAFIIIDINKFDDLPEVDMPENAYVAYKIASASISEIEAFYKNLFLSSSRKYEFCLLIDHENELKKSNTEFNGFIDFLVSLSFHSSYIKTHSDNPLVLFGINNTGTDKYISVIRQAFRSQGYEDIKARVIGKDDIFLLQDYNTNHSLDLQKGPDNFSSNYINGIKKITSSDFFFFFFLEHPHEVPRLLNIIEETDVVIRRDMFQVYSLLTESKSLNLKNNQLIFELELLQEQIDSLGNYHLNYNTTIVRYKKQITELLKFYKNEYEVLPLWYKRLGHIIKVFMGKRSFRSLFDDKAKEYHN